VITDMDVRSLASAGPDAASRWSTLDLALVDLVETAEGWVRREPAVAASLVELGRGLTDPYSSLDARLAHVGAQVAAEAGQVREAERLLAEALTGYQRSDDPLAAARLGLGWAHVRVMAGDFAGAEQRLDELLGACDSLADQEVALGLRAKATLNRAAIHDLCGRHRQASSLFAEAGRLATEAGDAHLRLQALNNRAHSLARAGRAGESLGVSRQLLDEVDPAAEPMIFALAHETLGGALVLAGELGEAIDSLELAESMFEELDALDRLIEVRTSLAEAYLATNLADDALRVLDRLVDLIEPDQLLRAARVTLSRGRAHALLMLGAARDELVEAAALHEQMGDRSGQLAALVSLAEFEISVDRPIEALARLEQARLVADPVADPAGALLVELTAARVDPTLALDSAESLLDLCDLAPLRAIFLARKGRSALANGDSAGAVAHLDAAVTLFERSRESLVHGRHRRSYLMARLEVFEDLVTAHLNTGGEQGVRAALETVERSRARGLLDLVHTSLLSKSPDTQVHDVDALQRLSADIGASYDRLLGPDGGRGSGVLLEQANQLEVEFALAMEGSGRTRLETVGSPIDGPDLGHTLCRLDATVVSYHWFDGKLEAFVIDADDSSSDGLAIRRVELGASGKQIETLRYRIEAAWSRLRPTLGLEARFGDPLLRSGRAVVSAARLVVWEPLWRQSRPPRRVVVVPVTGIEALPFAAIVDDQDKPVELVVSPSISLWASCENRVSNGQPERALVMGYAGSGLAHVESEAKDVAVELPSDSTLLVGPDATAEAVRSHHRPAILHLAAHGLFRQTNPMFSALRLADSWMSATELMTLDLRGSLVLLSACETGRADLLPDAEGFGFVRAALAAGARTFVGSHWLVNDRSTADLMRGFHQGIAANLSPSAALAAAQRQLSETYPHPYHWSSFTIAGAGFSRAAMPSRSTIESKSA